MRSNAIGKNGGYEAMGEGMMLLPFWHYFGGKYRAAMQYPQPTYGTVIEPFAGAAGYSLRHHMHRVVLVEKYPVVAGIWRYLIQVRTDEIARIPLVEHVDDLPAWVPQEARWLVGFNLTAGTTAPRKSLSAGRKKLRSMGRKFEGWSEAMRDRVANQVGHIRHWEVIEGDYRLAPNVPATWFIDPPYSNAGHHYIHPMREGYGDLATWCRSRSGQVIVCENHGADWLPFVPFGDIKSGWDRRQSQEVIWLNEQEV
jgi:hypothetical protein